MQLLTHSCAPVPKYFFEAPSADTDYDGRIHQAPTLISCSTAETELLPAEALEAIKALELTAKLTLKLTAAELAVEALKLTAAELTVEALKLTAAELTVEALKLTTHVIKPELALKLTDCPETLQPLPEALELAAKLTLKLTTVELSAEVPVELPPVELPTEVPIELAAIELAVKLPAIELAAEAASTVELAAVKLTAVELSVELTTVKLTTEVATELSAAELTAEVATELAAVPAELAAEVATKASLSLKLPAAILPRPQVTPNRREGANHRPAVPGVAANTPARAAAGSARPALVR